ncbi:WD domain, G-beta repeat [Gimesia panareensis]|uniref:WD domain, G-beta repeat n=1 Tax=Gimesia panareensis TaxID=2527978 RepID=A0A517Q422_9PLAN|nr:AAA family ATPase [Gimesia panareensis]QDT26372.1 WD domain, G-beta repeat [Gimesia panareensis]
MTTKRLMPVIRVFVSSTFNDLKLERNALSKHVFPNLEEYCASKGFQFQAIDLRWGVSKEAGLDHRTMRICFEELRRSQQISPRPNFLILSGNRYGWRPLPEVIQGLEYLQLRKAARHIQGIGDQPAKKILKHWYRKDRNTIPPVHILQPRQDEFKEDNNWFPVQNVLWKIINRAWSKDELATRFPTNWIELLKKLENDGVQTPQILRFQGSATEQEIWHGAFQVPDAAEHVVAWFRNIENLDEYLDDPSVRDFIDFDENGKIDTKARQAQEQLQTAINDCLQRLESSQKPIESVQVKLHKINDGKGNPILTVGEDHLEEFCSDIENRLKEIIEQQISTWGTQSKLEIEQQKHKTFGTERAPEESFVGRESELEIVQQYVAGVGAFTNGNERLPLVIYGDSGNGKTALMGKADSEIQQRTGTKPITRFIAATSQSSDVRNLLHSICQELRQSNPLEQGLPDTLNSLVDEFELHLDAAKDLPQPLVIVLDALDQLAESDNGRHLFWLRHIPLPENVRLIVTCLSDRKNQPGGESFEHLKSRLLHDGITVEGHPNFIKLGILSYPKANNLLFDKWLPQLKPPRKVNKEQRKAIEERLKTDECRKPLYLKLLFEEAKLWRSYDSKPAIGESIDELIKNLFTRLGEATNHGKTWEYSMMYIAASRYGLTENEIVGVLKLDKEYYKWFHKRDYHSLPKNAKRIPIAVWSRLRFDLEPYLTERTAPGAQVLSFYHRQFAEYIERDFLKGNTRQRFHTLLAGFFYGQLNPKNKEPWSRNDHHAISEMPWLYIQAAQEFKAPYDQSSLSSPWLTICEILLDFRFLVAKIDADLLPDLLNDIVDVRRNISTDNSQSELLQIVDESIRNDATFLKLHPNTLFQCVWNRYFQNESASITHLLHTWRSVKKSSSTPVWLRSLTPSNDINLSCDTNVLVGHRPGVSYVGFLPANKNRNEHFITGGSNGDNSIRIWETKTDQEVMCLLGHKSTVNDVAISPVEELIASASGDKTIRIWNLFDGCQKNCFEGHNQAVTAVTFSPDGKRIISCSEDRTVRVWDIKTGKPIKILKGHSSKVLYIAYRGSGSQFITADASGTILTWKDQDLTRTIDPEINVGGEVLALSSDGELAVAMNNDEMQIQLFETRNAKLIGFCALTTDFIVNCATFSTDNQLVAIGTLKGVSIAEIKACLNMLPFCDYFNCECVAFSPNTTSLAFGSIVDSNARIRNVPEVATLFESAYKNVYEKQRSAISHLEGKVEHEKAPSKFRGFSPDGKWILTTSHGEMIGSYFHIWDPSSITCIISFGPGTLCANDVDISPDGRQIASSADDGTARVWDVALGQQVHCFGVDEAHVDEIFTLSHVKGGAFKSIGNEPQRLAFHPDGCSLAVAYGNGKFEIYTLETGRVICSFESGLRPIHSIVFSPDGQDLVFCAADTVLLWSVAKSSELMRWKMHGIVTSFSFSPDGSLLAIGLDSGKIHVYHRNKNEEIVFFEGHSDPVRQITFFNDCLRIASGTDTDNSANEVLVWNVNNCKESERVNGLGNTDDWSSESFPILPIMRDSDVGVLDNVIEFFEVSSKKSVGWYPWNHLSAHLEVSHIDNRIVLVGDQSHSELLQIEGYDYDRTSQKLPCLENSIQQRMPLRTLTRIYDRIENQWEANLTLSCPSCMQRFSPPQSVVHVIRGSFKTQNYVNSLV